MMMLRFMKGVKVSYGLGMGPRYISKISLLKQFTQSVTQPHWMRLQGILMNLNVAKAALMHISPLSIITVVGLNVSNHCIITFLFQLESENVCVSVTISSPLHMSGRYSHRQRPQQRLPHQRGSYEGSLQPSEAWHHQPVCDRRRRQSDRSQPVQD